MGRAQFGEIYFYNIQFYNREMLGKLVNKFKRQTLQDGCDLPIGQMSPPPGARSANTTEIGTASAAAGTRRSARLNEKAEKEKANWGAGGALHVGSPNSPSPPNTVCVREIT
jgi:hypothetical protein